MKNSPSELQTTLKELSDRLVFLQKPIRILNAIKWDDHIKEDFLNHKGKKLPAVTKDYYANLPLNFEARDLRDNLIGLEHQIHKKLGQFNPIGMIMTRMCQEYRTTIDMLVHRGQHQFTELSQELYGSVSDVFYVNGPSLKDLADNLSLTLKQLGQSWAGDKDDKRYTSKEAVQILSHRLGRYFTDPHEKITVKSDDGIVADAAAGAEVLKLRKDALFSERDLKILEVHEGWVHVGTTLNGKNQPYCTFLSKGTPSTTLFQEGLAILIEMFSFVSSPQRIQRLIDRIHAVHMAENGANFIEVFHFYLGKDPDMENAYRHTVRIFRGSLPNLGPFTKDIVYSKGFVLIFNYIRLAIAEGKLDQIPLLFLGKVHLEDLRVYANLIEEGTIVAPKYLPVYFKDIAALSSWMAYSLFLSTLSLEPLFHDYRSIL
ncbi:MAG: uncharacterized protein K0R48_348 [Gammaproteobacteria bacterium]|jgi:uncharacterized protein (TIGR02421 family)|nr:uncharacterized protein [Gammaproteobacteria bacterium]